ncbi:4'-phosphopantetheinyl transferase superfamily protein [Francisella tularensis subsp. novicida]|uniref:4'-phosphopantetheinyl transferase family protein n=1 Tax=Francisella tularensis TaxID=263 RepID=UPI00050313DF|nr:4'-phosphopantetheinyl transferase superfamily protein [Francisella tularensis]AJJ48307.1 4'-phosphopantetheinyl transferase superfamily protein [Francisella tularensis subsp. novicida]KFJ70268.1 4'-phosphopantetheinyl transferase superfamily protein [Francisella tularensis subsp. novicida]MBK2345259.1 4'-phosphopantetheinyl transferase superfamily protein [Francisella tularensis subsp. novicida]MBK2350610.1 4'-phosphopantetheinyl transferase superfamily protein [Francisella tularensis subsp
MSKKSKIEFDHFNPIDINKNSVSLGVFSLDSNINDDVIIPNAQTKDIDKYKKVEDIAKRVIARKKLYSFVKEKYNLLNFDVYFNKYHKPRFVNSNNIYFSFSYSKEYIFIGVADLQIGVDIEYIDETLNIDDLANVIMHPLEYSYFISLSLEKRRIFFFRVFNIKESIIKAIGTGLYYDVKKINILDIDNNENYQLDEHKLAIRELNYFNHFRFSICLVISSEDRQNDE